MRVVSIYTNGHAELALYAPQPVRGTEPAVVFLPRTRPMCVSDVEANTSNDRSRGATRRCGDWARRSLRFVIYAMVAVCLLQPEETRAQESEWELVPVEASVGSSIWRWTCSDFDPGQQTPAGSTIRFRHTTDTSCVRISDPSVAPAELQEPIDSPTPPLPSYLKPPEEMPQPPLLDTENPNDSVTNQLDQLSKRLDELEKTRISQEDATRAIIRKSFAERASNITDTVTFGGTLETLTFWQSNFDGSTESDIRLDTAELDFDVQMNTWSRASLYIEYSQGGDFLFPTSEGDVVGVDRFIVRRGIITIGNVEKYPVYITTGRDFVPFGISTGDPVTDVLTITDPLTVEVFETQEDFVMFGFELPTPPPPAPVSPYSVPPIPPRPILFNPLARSLVNTFCPYCGPYEQPKKPVATPATCVAPYTGAIYFYNGNTLEGVNDSNQIEQMGGTLGYRTRGVLPGTGTPWNLQANVDVNSSVFDSNFLQFEYRHFLDQIGFVPGMAAHVKSSIGPIGIIVEWNGAISDAHFTDDAGNPVDIRPSAWQIALGYQFDCGSHRRSGSAPRNLLGANVFGKPGSCWRHAHRRSTRASV